MSEHGFNGRELQIIRDGVVLAAVQTKSAPHAREPVDVTTDDDDGWRRLLPFPGRRSIDLTVEGVCTPDSYAWMRDEWLGNTFADMELHHPDGASEIAEDGFFLSALEFSGEENGHVAFTASFQSSGPVSVVGGS